MSIFKIRHSTDLRECKWRACAEAEGILLNTKVCYVLSFNDAAVSTFGNEAEFYHENEDTTVLSFCLSGKVLRKKMVCHQQVYTIMVSSIYLYRNSTGSLWLWSMNVLRYCG